MPIGGVLAALLLQLVTAGAAVWGVARCVRLLRFGADRRLTALAWFFGLFAAAILLNAAWQVQVGASPSFPSRGVAVDGLVPDGQGTPDNGTRGPFTHFLFRPEGTERANVWLAGHHALMLASLVVGVWAFGHRRRHQQPAAQPATPPAAPPAAGLLAIPLLAAPFGLVGELVPAMLAMEAGLTLYLAARAFLNHVEVRSPGAVQVALGFLFFFLGHLLFSVAHQPGMGRSSIGDVLNLVGIVLLVQVLPGKR